MKTWRRRAAGAGDRSGELRALDHRPASACVGIRPAPPWPVSPAISCGTSSSSGSSGGSSSSVSSNIGSVHQQFQLEHVLRELEQLGLDELGRLEWKLVPPLRRLRHGHGDRNGHRCTPGFSRARSAQAPAPVSGPPGQICSEPQYSFLGPDHEYTLTFVARQMVRRRLHETERIRRRLPRALAVVVDVPPAPGSCAN